MGGGGGLNITQDYAIRIFTLIIGEPFFFSSPIHKPHNLNSVPHRRET